MSITKKLRAMSNREMKEKSQMFDRYELQNLDPFINHPSVDSDENSDYMSIQSHHIEINDRPVLATKNIGLKRGQTTFDVDGIKEYNESEPRLQREDGRKWESDDPKDEGGYFEADWRDEESKRQEILERDPNYTFVSLVAGNCNAQVRDMYDESDIYSIFRREQALLNQQKVAIEETRTSIKQLNSDIDSINRDLSGLNDSEDSVLSAISGLDQIISSFEYKLLNYLDYKANKTEVDLKESILKFYISKQSFSPNDALGIYDQILDVAKIIKRREPKLEISIDSIEEYKSESNPENDTLGSYVYDLLDRILDIWTKENLGDEKYEDFSQYFLPRKATESQSDFQRRIETAYATRRLNIERNQIPHLAEEKQQTGSDLDEVRNDFFSQFKVVIYYLYEKGLISITKSDIYRELSVTNPSGIYIPDVPPILEFSEIKKKPVVFSKDQQVAVLLRKDLNNASLEILYDKYGGIAFLKKGERGVPIEELYTSQFSGVVKGIQQSLSRDEQSKLSGLGPNTRWGIETYSTVLRYYRYFLQQKHESISSKLLELGSELRTDKKRLSKLRNGEIDFKDLPQPYKHRRDWIELPQHSGIAKVKSIFTSALGNATNQVKQRTDFGRDFPDELLQFDETIRDEFSLLVAIHIALISLRMPKQYLQLGLKQYTVIDQVSSVNRLKNVYSLISYRDTDGDIKQKFVRKEKDDRCYNNLLR
jgi:hypothetical protein